MPKSITDHFLEFLQFRHLHKSKEKWLVAVSGGVDSIVLCHLCLIYNIPYAIAHCNFQLRGEESVNDQSFVKKFADSVGVEYFSKDFDTLNYANRMGLSIQVAARELRYQWFEQLASEYGFTFIATAHHANDNAETVLMNLFRGTGIKGIRGIRPFQKKVIRPMLKITKEAIIDYATAKGLNWVEDSSNNSDKYTRNFIRRQIFAIIKKIIPQAEEGFEKSVELLTEAEMLYEQVIILYKKKLIENKNNELRISVLKLAKVVPLKTIVYEIIKDFGFSSAQTGEVIALLNSESGKHVASSSHRIIRNRAWLMITSVQSEEASHILIEKNDSKIQFCDNILHIEYLSSDLMVVLPSDPNIALLDAGEISFPLILRRWKQGDYFYPLGMEKKKKLSRFFIDQKLSKIDKEKVWVVESNKKILWIIGFRIDDRFKITNTTKHLLKLRVKS